MRSSSEKIEKELKEINYLHDTYGEILKSWELKALEKNEKVLKEILKSRAQAGSD